MYSDDLECCNSIILSALGGKFQFLYLSLTQYCEQKVTKKAYVISIVYFYLE